MLRLSCGSRSSVAVASRSARVAWAARQCSAWTTHGETGSFPSMPTATIQVSLSPCASSSATKSGGSWQRRFGSGHSAKAANEKAAKCWQSRLFFAAKTAIAGGGGFDARWWAEAHITRTNSSLLAANRSRSKRRSSSVREPSPMEDSYLSRLLAARHYAAPTAARRADPPTQWQVSRLLSVNSFDGRNGMSSRRLPKRIRHVTPRQAEILDLALRGLTDKEIAARLQIAVSTVRTYLERFYRENGLRNKTEAVAAWQHHRESLHKPTRRHTSHDR